MTEISGNRREIPGSVHPLIQSANRRPLHHRQHPPTSSALQTDFSDVKPGIMELIQEEQRVRQG